jgi:tetratricopeptide (TPR) repeat protein
VRYRAVRRVDVAITYRIIDATTGEVLASQSISRKNYRETGSGGRYEAFALHATKAGAIKRLPPWRPIVEGQVKELASAAVRYVAPHYVWRKRKVDKGKSPAMKAGLEYAKRGLWDEARESWESVLADRSEKARKDHVAARYNLGVYHEIHGNLDEAEECFDACFKATGKGRYLDARANIDARRRELQRLEQQLDSGGDGS